MALAALLLLPHQAQAQAPAKAGAKPGEAEWVTSVATYRLDEKAAEPGTTDFSGVGSSWLERWQWITPADLPPEYRRRSLRNQSIVVIEVDTAGKPGGCRPLRAGTEPRLDALTCDLLMKRASFPIRYSAPARPMPYRFPASVLWRNMAAAEVGPAPLPMFVAPAPRSAQVPPSPSGSIPSYAAWPRLNWANPLIWDNDIVPGPPPAIQAGWPGKEGTASLDLTLSVEKGATECRIGVSSGDADLDEAACRVARTLPVRYQRPCERCQDRTLPLQVVWKKKGSFIRLPLAHDAPAYVASRRVIAGAIRPADLADLPDRSVSRRDPAALVSIDRDGRPTKCSLMQYSSGNRALDARLCELVMKRTRFSTRTDVFAEPAADLYWARFDLDGLL